MTDETANRDVSDTTPPPERDVLAAGSPRRRHWGRLGLVITVVAGLGLAAGGVAIAAGDGSPKPSASPAPDGEGLPPRGPFLTPFGPGDPPFGPGIGPVGPALHGELTVPKEGGGYQTVHIQRGTVTAVSHSSITVRSADGFTDTYAVDDKSLVDAGRDGIGSIKSGHDVSLTAWSVAGTDTVRQLFDETLVSKYIERYGLPKRPPFLRDLRHLKMRWRAHVRDWTRDGGTSSSEDSSSVVG